MDRFKKVYRQGTIEVVEIWVDTETGLTPLLDKDGKPVVSSELSHK